MFNPNSFSVTIISTIHEDESWIVVRGFIMKSGGCIGAPIVGLQGPLRFQANLFIAADRRDAGQPSPTGWERF